MHYVPMPHFNEADISRFWSYVEIAAPDACWLWSLTKSTGGYGQISFARKNRKAHRVAYFLHYGVDPESKLVCHRCDNPPCCNPSHLFLGTEKDNTQDAKRKGRLKAGVGARHGTKTHPESHANGERSVKSKLTDETARLVRDLYASGQRQHEIAAQVGITREGVSQIVRGNNWKHVIRPDEPLSLSDPSRHARFGDDSPRSKVTSDQVREIRALWAAGGITRQVLGERYGITKHNVYSIVHRITWKDVD